MTIITMSREAGAGRTKSRAPVMYTKRGGA